MDNRTGYKNQDPWENFFQLESPFKNDIFLCYAIRISLKKNIQITLFACKSTVTITIRFKT